MWAQFCATSTPTMQKRFGDGIRRYANAAQGVVHNRENRRNYSVEEYVVTRRDFGGVEVLECSKRPLIWLTSSWLIVVSCLCRILPWDRNPWWSYLSPSNARTPGLYQWCDNTDQCELASIRLSVFWENTYACTIRTYTASTKNKPLG